MADLALAHLPPLSAVVPHKGDMLLLDRVLEHDPASTCCGVEIGAQRWLTREDGSISVWVGLEYMAQCIAAHEGYRAWAAGRPLRRGLLVGSRALRFHRQRFSPGESLRVHARHLRGRPELGVLAYACEIRSDRDGPEGQLLAGGTLNVALLGDAPGRTQ